MTDDRSSKKRKRPVSKKDRQLFRDAVGPLRRIRSDRPPSADAPRRAPVPEFTEADEKNVLDQLLRPSAGSEPGEVMHAQPGVQPKVLKKLRRGQFRIDAETDLHAMTEEAARQHLLDFLDTCRRENLRCVRVVHGKGLRSGHGGPVIKPMVERELTRRKQVLAFCSARPAHGGSGAVYVLLSR